MRACVRGCSVVWSVPNSGAMRLPRNVQDEVLGELERSTMTT